MNKIKKLSRLLMFSWFNKRRVQRKESALLGGYEFAAGLLLKKHWSAVEELHGFIDTSRSFQNYDEFDIGIEEALRDFRKLWKHLSNKEK